MNRSARIRERLLDRTIIGAILGSTLVGSSAFPGEDLTRPVITITVDHGPPRAIRRGPDRSPDGKVRVVAGRLDVRLVEAKTGRLIGLPLRPVGRGEVTTWTFSPDGKLFAAANGGPRRTGELGEDGGICVWEVATGEVVAKKEATALVSGLAFDPGGKSVSATADEIDGP
jgi:WD40 repeat protein